MSAALNDTDTPAIRAGTVETVRPAALPLDQLGQEAGIPVSTLRAVMAAGHGPRTFVVGRRRLCLRRDFETWLAGLAESGGVRLTGRRWAAQQRAADLT